MTSAEVPFLNVGSTYFELRESIEKAVRRVLESGNYLLGPELERFEEAWADYCEAKECVGVASGLDALILALRALDVGPGDEVIVPSHTFVATWLAVSSVGATIIPVDPDVSTYNLSAQAIELAISSRTAAIIPVHLYGHPTDTTSIDELARRYGIPVIYDAAQAHGARVFGRGLGSFGSLTAWSFYPGKNLGAYGDGGAVTTNDASLARTIRRLRNYGSIRKYEHELRGCNSRLDEMQAAVLLTKLEKLDEWNSRRVEIANLYLDRLDQTGLALPRVIDGHDAVWHLFVVRSTDRASLQAGLLERGVRTGVHYPTPPHKQPAYISDLKFELPVAELLAEEVLSLPIGPHLQRSDATRVVDAILQVLEFA